MKRMIVLLLAAALLLSCFSALADMEVSETLDFPESEAYAGTWYVDDYILEIVHMDDDYNLYNCIVTQYNSDGRTGTRWIYDACSNDDVGKTLTSMEIGMKFTIELDKFGELLSNEEIYTDGAASFAINGEGKLVWTDFKETPGENEMTFEKVVEETEATPEDAYMGTWAADQTTLLIEDLDDIIYCTVRKTASDTEVTVWSYENCTYDEVSGGLTTLETGVKTNVVVDASGEEVSSEEEFTDGAASFVLNAEGKLVWTDFKQTPGENEVVFERVEEEP